MDTPQHTFVPETGQSTHRRRKARLACNPCRARKTGCDGRKPVCSACSLRGWEDKCGYPDSVIQPSAALTLVEIDRRLQKLESETRAEPDSKAVPNVTLAPSVLGPISGPAGLGYDSDDQTLGAPLDAFASNNQPTMADNAAFLRQGLEVPSARLSQDTTLPNSESPMSALDSPRFPRLVGFSNPLDQPLDDIDPHAMVLPPRQFGDDLLRLYWLNFHSVFPFLHWPMFENRYDGLWKQKTPLGDTFDELLFYAKLNMVLALASLRNEAIPPPHRHFHADEFYKRSVGLMSVETLDTNSIPVVQLLLLRGLYLYFAGMADRCWLISGAAIRAAIGMGLNSASKGKPNQLEREMRRRVWFAGCVSLDQILAATFGRPGMIFPGLSQIPLPMAIDDVYLSTTDEGRQPDGIPSYMDMLIYSARILELVEEMRKAAHAPRLKVNQQAVSQQANDDSELSLPDPSILLRVNSKIDDLLDGMPAHLRPDADLSKMPLSEGAVKCFRIQGHALRFRLLLLRVFLLRPSLLAEAQRWTTPNPGTTHTASLMLQERFHQEICALCLTTVHTVLSEIHGSLASNGGMSAWYALHFTFASATILLVATLSPTLGVNLETEPARSSWDRALAILDYYKAHVTSAARGIEVLLRYRESITLRTSARSGPSSLMPIHHLIAFSLKPPTNNNTAQADTHISSSTLPTAATPFHPSSSYPQHDHQHTHTHPQHHHQQQHHQQYTHPQPWETSQSQPQSIPIPPSMAGTTVAGMMVGLDEFLVSDSLDEAWLTTQDFGQGNWMLRF